MFRPAMHQTFRCLERQLNVASSTAILLDSILASHNNTCTNTSHSNICTQLIFVDCRV